MHNMLLLHCWAGMICGMQCISRACLLWLPGAERETVLGAEPNQHGVQLCMGGTGHSATWQPPLTFPLLYNDRRASPWQALRDGVPLHTKRRQAPGVALQPIARH